MRYSHSTVVANGACNLKLTSHSFGHAGNSLERRCDLDRRHRLYLELHDRRMSIDQQREFHLALAGARRNRDATFAQDQLLAKHLSRGERIGRQRYANP